MHFFGDFQKQALYVADQKYFYESNSRKSANFSLSTNHRGLNGIVSRGFEWLQMISVNGIWVPDVPLKVYFLEFSFSYSFLGFKFSAG